MDDVTETFFLCLSNMARTFEMYSRLFRNKQVKDLKRWDSCASYLFVWFCFYHFLTLSVIYNWTDVRQHGIYLQNVVNRKGTLRAGPNFVQQIKKKKKKKNLLAGWTKVYEN